MSERVHNSPNLVYAEGTQVVSRRKPNRMKNSNIGYDIIGDIHGHADELKALLADLGYIRHGRGYRHGERNVVFVGDFVDRGPAIVDKGGHERDAVRIKWYEDGAGRTYAEHHLGSDVAPDVMIEEADLASIETYPRDAVPVFVGHYWLKGVPMPLAPNVACTDYSVAKGGKLVAYRWDGESVLSSAKFRWVGKK